VVLMMAVGWVQVKVLLTEAVTVGTAVLLKTVVVATAVAPLAAVTVTEYGPAVLTVIDGVAAPLLQTYVTPGEAVVLIVAVGWAQVSVLLTEAVTVGAAVSLKTVVVVVAVQPLAAVTVTE
jgi:hypothetical protein